MGLDNGVCIIRNEYTHNIPELKCFELDYDKEHKYDFEAAYWRKCWGLRNDVLYLLGKSCTDEGELHLTKGDVDHIIELLQSYNSDNWEDSIWDWDDEEWPYSEKIKDDIESLKVLRGLMDKYELEVCFYDSY